MAVLSFVLGIAIGTITLYTWAWPVLELAPAKTAPVEIRVISQDDQSLREGEQRWWYHFAVDAGLGYQARPVSLRWDFHAATGSRALARPPDCLWCRSRRDGI